MTTSGQGDGRVTITYTVGPHPGDPPARVAGPDPRPHPGGTHQPLPFTGAPVVVELLGSFALLLAGAVAALSATVKSRTAARPGERPLRQG